MWCGLIACLHLFWALGGLIGLASSAGHDLAERRPVSFIIFGLFGVALCLLIGIAVIAITQSARIARRWRHAAAVLLAVVGVGVAIRGVALELLLATNAGGLRASVGPLETHWSLVLWSPMVRFRRCALHRDSNPSQSVPIPPRPVPLASDPPPRRPSEVRSVCGWREETLEFTASGLARSRRYVLLDHCTEQS